MHNKRNYYRILHVQCDAPTAVIKASYRAIMQKLCAHPDLGGEQWNASLINEARNVLLNPERRAAYDVQLGIAGAAINPRSDWVHAQSDVGGRPYCEPNKSEKAAHTTRYTENLGSELAVDPASSKSHPACPFCHNLVSQKSPVLQAYPTAYRCTYCDAPLNNIDTISHDKHNDLRKINRSELEQLVSVWDKWPRNSGYTASVHDWSTAGCCMQLHYAIKVNSVILLLSSAFDAIAIVRNQFDNTFYGLEFLTLEVKMAPGSLFESAA